MPRQQLTAMQGKVPPALALHVRDGTGHGQAARNPRTRQAGSSLCSSRVVPGKAAPGDPLVRTGPHPNSGQIAGREYVDQLRAAVREAVGVKRNENAIAALRKQLLGGQ